MTRIRVTCQGCGSVEVTTSDINVNPDTGSQLSYWFTCPICKVVTFKNCERRIYHLLIVHKCNVKPFVVPREFEEAKDILGEPFTPNDVLDMHNLLCTEDWFEKLVSS